MSRLAVVEVPRPRFTRELAWRVKLGATTVTGNVVVEVLPPSVPVTVAVYSPVAAELLACSVNTLFPFTVGLGENEAVTPLGRPDTASCRLPGKPYCE